eukprot:gene12714-6912_t
MGQTSSAEGFNSSSTANDVLKGIDLTGKTALITGSNTGIGYETARALCSVGARVIICGRNKEKLEAAKKEIQKSVKDGKIDSLSVDLGDLSSIKQFAEDAKKLDVKIDILILNAGVLSATKQTTKDGFDYVMGVNHLGHFALTIQLLPLMNKESDDSRIVVLTGDIYKTTIDKIDYDDFHFEKTFGARVTYSSSKLCNVMFAKAINRKLKRANIPITANSLHPGVIKTELGRDWTVGYALLGIIGFAAMKSIPQGAATSCYVATNPSLKKVGGLHFDNCQTSDTIPFAEKDEEQDKLWDYSENQTGVYLKNYI